jgi:hypothetical protein
MTTTTERLVPGRSGRARRRLLVLLPVIALVLGAALWWWSHPRAFSEAGSGASVQGEPGRVVVDGVDVSYRTGVQQGTQWTGIDVIVEVAS